MMGGWNEIVQDGGSGLVDLFGDFKDSCVKEVRYVSGAYVDEELARWPYNDKRTLILLLQRQEEGPAAIELAFDGVECFHLEPAGEEYDCSIIRAEFYWREGMLWWSTPSASTPDIPPMDSSSAGFAPAPPAGASGMSGWETGFFTARGTERPWPSAAPEIYV